ncbi:MAG: hypothetical protein K2K52_00800 [Paramuribaculum sp.]|nr:hypothetical protein [Paramuribaculum sp.]
MRKNILQFALIAVAVATSLCSCSRTEELLATVPASSQGVIALNLESVASACGFEFKDTTLVIPETLRLPDGTRDRIEKILPELREAVDISDVVISTVDNRNIFATFLLKDQEILRKILTQNGASALGNKDGFDAYSLDDVTVYIGDGQGWAINGSDNYTPKTILTEVKNGNFKKEYPEISSFLSENKMISIAATGRSMNLGADRWVCADIQSKNNDIVLVARSLDAEGKVIANSSLKSLDASALSLVPDNAAIVLAAGLTKDIDWNSILVIGAFAGGFQTGGMLESVLPYISKTDGTIEFAAAPINSEAWTAPSIMNWDFVFAAQMNAADGASAVNAARDYLGGMFAVTDIDNGFVAGMQGMSFKVTSADGIFSIVKGDLNSGAAMKEFSGDRLVVKADIPRGVLLRNSGVSVVSVTGESDTEMTVSLPGSDKPLLQAVLEEIFR